MSEDIFECPLDESPASENLGYLNKHPSEIIPKCHNYHPLFQTSSQIYKLSCYHYSCIKCINLDTCRICKAPIDLKEKKIDIKADYLIDFCNFFCEDHNSLANRFSSLKFRFYCESCKNSEGSDIEDINYLIKIINQKFISTKANIEVKNFQFSVKKLKMIQYFNILPFRTRYLLTKELVDIDEIETNCENNYLVVNRFKDLFPTQSNSKKIWEIMKDEPIRFILNSQKLLILVGFIIGGKYHKEFTGSELNFSYFSLKAVKIILDAKVIFESSGSRMYCNKINEIALSHYAIIEENKDYLIELQFSQGFYVHGRPFTRADSEIFKIKVFKEENSKSKSFKNYAIGGLILGLLVKMLEI